MGYLKKGQLFIISGPSGSGKGSICRKLIKDTDIYLSISMTTRAVRNGEKHGENYFFVSEEEFNKIIVENGFLEYATVYEHKYGTPKSLILEKLNEGIDVLLEIDIQGALQVKKAYPNGAFIFILPPSMNELRKRLIGREAEKNCNLELRLREAFQEVSYIDKYDYCIINDKLDDAVNDVKAIIQAEHSRVSEEVYSLIDGYKEEI